MKKFLNSLLVFLSILLMSDAFIDAARHNHRRQNRRGNLNAKALRQKPHLVMFLNQYYKMPQNQRNNLIVQLKRRQNQNNGRRRPANRRLQNKHANRRRAHPAVRRPSPVVQRPAPAARPSPVVARPVVQRPAPSARPSPVMQSPVVQRPAPAIPQARPSMPIAAPVISRPVQQLIIDRTANRNWRGMDHKLPLPGSVQNMPFEYIHSKQQNGWSCGYNCLFNACNVENYFGRSNRNSDLNNFSAVCMNYLNRIGQSPTAGSSAKDLKHLAKDLNLHKMFDLCHQNGQIGPFISHWTYGHGISQSQAIQNAKNQKVQDLKNHLNQNRGTTTFVHFICSIPGHWVLISLVQKPNGDRSFYIFDNINSTITEGSHIKSYIQYLNNNFR